MEATYFKYMITSIPNTNIIHVYVSKTKFWVLVSTTQHQSFDASLYVTRLLSQFELGNKLLY